MITDFLTWTMAVLRTCVDWLDTMTLVDGVSLLGFMVATFVLGLLIRNLIFRAQ